MSSVFLFFIHLLNSSLRTMEPGQGHTLCVYAFFMDNVQMFECLQVKSKSIWTKAAEMNQIIVKTCLFGAT